MIFVRVHFYNEYELIISIGLSWREDIHEASFKNHSLSFLDFSERENTITMDELPTQRFSTFSLILRFQKMGFCGVFLFY